MSIPTQATFLHPAPFVGAPESDDVLSITGVGWFVDILRRIPELTIDPELCQEDWGAVIFVTRHGHRFWVGISVGPFESAEPGKQSWMVQIHHKWPALLRILSPGSATQRDAIVTGLQAALVAAPDVSGISWFHGSDVYLDP